MSTYTVCTGSQQSAIDAHRVNVNGLGSKFSHMRGKSYGACPICGRTGLVVRANGTVPSHKAQEKITPIAIDTTPAGIYAAMMRANASESAAPQSRLYGLLSDYLRRTLAAEYGTVAAEHIYAAALSSGEFNEETIPYGLESVQYSRTEDVTARDLRTGDTVSTDVGPVLLVKDNGARGLLDVRNFTGRILSVPSVPDHCTWILRANVVAGHSVDYWAVQGAATRHFRRYV